jgi:DNA polymerase type B, organellar and viral
MLSKFVKCYSEYPYVNKTKVYPVGHPTVIKRNFGDVRNYFGLIQCDILPPRDLELPVIPYRANGKLTFPLCRTCVETQQNAPCQHIDQQRVLTGVWCTPEIHAAIDRGYSIVRIHEVWHYARKKEQFWSSYIDVFLKIKQEASGWPVGVETDEEKDAYIQDYCEHEGIMLDKKKIAVNPGLRALAKLCMNR